MAVELFYRNEDGEVTVQFFPAKRVMANIAAGWVVDPTDFEKEAKNNTLTIDTDLVDLTKQQIIELVEFSGYDLKVDNRMNIATMQGLIMEYRAK